MKKLLTIIGITVGLAVLTAGGCGWSVEKLAQAILNDKPQIVNRFYPAVRWCGGGLPFVDNLYSIIDNKTYIVLLQNNTELRPTGGFMGSFVKVRFEDGGLKELRVQDIYQPDGQLPGHVEPPYPIQEGFGQGWWKLRDANWDPDFTIAGRTITWFLEQGGVSPVDGVVAINLDLIKKWLKILGEVKIITYGQTVNADNIYQLAQSQAELNWKPGSTQKRDFLGAAGVAVLEQSKGAPFKQKMKLAKLLWDELRSKQIMVWMKDEVVQKEIVKMKWDGGLGKPEDDYLYIVEANLGANKANCCIERQVEQEIKTENGKRQEVLTVKWKNNNPTESPKPPENWGGFYVNYVRVIIPAQSEAVEVMVNQSRLRKATAEDFVLPNSLRHGRSEEMYTEEEKGEFKTVGLWVVTPHTDETIMRIDYTTENLGNGYKLLVRRQPGIDKFKYRLFLNGDLKWDQEIDRDTIISTK